jgi:NAD(P)-dependent dehydrogenase (short-subunit alcohol dehydrogenase family)
VDTINTREMNNLNVLITGATSGIGKETGKALAEKGANIIIASRDMAKGKAVKSEIDKTSQGKVSVLHCDLASQDSIRRCCAEYRQQYDKLDVLINNAGVWNTRFKETPDGIEETLAVNVLGPYMMTCLLLDPLRNASPSRIINVSSGLHFGNISFKDIEYRQKFSGFHAYRQSKLAVILLTRLLAGKLNRHGISVNCMHPGLVDTQLGRHGSSFFNAFFRIFGKSAEKGADTLVYLASSPEVADISGEYFTNRKVHRTTSQSYDMQLAGKLLRVIEEKTGLIINI